MPSKPDDLNSISKPIAEGELTPENCSLNMAHMCLDTWGQMDGHKHNSNKQMRIVNMPLIPASTHRLSEAGGSL